jgi:DNA invertase Pin-like site-specific DNA recombinase
MAISNSKKSTRKNGLKSPRVKPSEAIGYIRVSTEEQADSGLSLESQRARIKAQSEANGWTLAGIYEDAGISAKTLNRPGLHAALKQLRPGRVLVALKLDRLTRSVPDLYELDALVSDRGGEWASISEHIDTTTATGRMMRTFIATIAEWERGIIAERTAAALGEKKVRREHLGAPPLGYKVIEGADGAKIVVEDSDEMQTVCLVRELRAAGQSLRQIAAGLEASGRKTKRGGQWSAAAVRNLLKTRYLESIGNGANSGAGWCADRSANNGAIT